MVFVDNKGTLTFPFQFNTDKKPISAYLGNENVKIKIQIKNTNSQLPSFFNLFSIEAATLKYSNSSSFIENDNYQYDLSLTSSQKISNKEWELFFESGNFLLFDKTFASFLTSMELKFIGNSFTNDVLNMLDILLLTLTVTRKLMVRCSNFHDLEVILCLLSELIVPSTNTTVSLLLKQAQLSKTPLPLITPELDLLSSFQF